jgi:phosphoribosylanthranilate isomerase
VRVKICGIARAPDALAAVEAGATAIGLVFAESPRRVALEVARHIVSQLPPFFPVVGVFRDPSADDVRRTLAACSLTHLQFHGREDPEFVRSFGFPALKAIPISSPADLDLARAFLRAAPGVLLMADAREPGSGRTCDWGVARALAAETPLVLAGGLTPDNVRDAIAQVAPAAVDVSSGVESAPGVKDHEKIAAFVRRAAG